MCQCNEKYTGIGYIGCTRIPGTEEEEKPKTDTGNYFFLIFIKK